MNIRVLTAGVVIALAGVSAAETISMPEDTNNIMPVSAGADAVVSTSAATESGEAKPQRRATKQSSLKAIFQSAIGKYPYEVRLFEKPMLKKRLISLLGQNRFNTMIKYFQVQTPIEFSNWNYHTMGGQTHNMDVTRFDISYNPEQNALAVRYMVDGIVKVYKENPSVNASWDYE